ncbi:integrase core domain-containing protein [Anoxybacter fermentans]|uniref:integrase core domain-containing protein n=1 Tax=Anoxybacter fermentans TaxID=1323375 RepID=UPI000F8D14BC
MIESFFGTFKDWYKQRKGFNNFVSANQLIFMFIYFYNYVRPNSAPNNLTPAQVAGCNYSDKQRKPWLLAA